MLNEDGEIIIPVENTRVSGRIPLILFTGGMDSTFMLHNALQRSNCDTLYVEMGQYSKSREKELEAQVELFKALEGAPHSVVNRFTATAPVIQCSKNDALTLGARLLMAAITVVDPHRHSVVMIGGTRTDTLSLNKDKLNMAWRGLTILSKWKPVPLEVPLLHDTKYDVLTNLPKPLLNRTWVCEHPSEAECGVCAPCVELANTLATYHRLNGVEFSKTLLTSQE